MKAIYVKETPTMLRVSFAYNAQLVDMIKRVNQYHQGAARWNGEEKVWTVYKWNVAEGEHDANWFVTVMGQWAKSKGIVSLVKWLKEEDEAELEIEPMQPIDGEHYMLMQPYQYQLEGVRYALDKKRCIFGDQPGLGKTLQAICAVIKAHNEADTYGESLPALVVCPASLKINWQREWKKFAGIDAIILDDKNKESWHRYYEAKRGDGSPICPVFITNYESLKKFFVKEVKGRLTLKNIVLDERVGMFRTIIIDESHKCKSWKTQQSKYVEAISKGKPFVFELTGTPVVNCNIDLIQQLRILGRLEEFGGYHRFIDVYCDGPKQSSNLKKLNYNLWRTCFFRREKQKVLTQLPNKMRQYITCDITNRKEYQAAERDVIGYLRQYKQASDEQTARAMRGLIMVKIGILKEIAARGKVAAVSDFIHDIIDGEHGEKLIMFAYLKEVVKALKDEFPGAVTVTGSDSIQEKQKAVDKFQNDEKTKLIILNYKSGGTGLTLTAASRVGFIEFPWTYSDCEQAEDRAHRNGQKNAVNCYYFIGDKTIDRYMYNVIQSKKSIANGVTGTETQVEEDIINIVNNLFNDSKIEWDK